MDIEGHTFFFHKDGFEPPPILLLCSTGLDSRQWNDLFPMIDSRSSICPHYLCYDGSDSWKGDGGIDPSLDYKLAESLLISQNGPVDIIGHSYGGFIGLRLAKEHPGKIRRMAFHEPIVWGCLQHTERDDLKNEFGEVVETFFTEGLDKEDFLRDFVDYWNKEGTWDEMPEIRKNSWMRIQQKILSEVRLLCYDLTPPSFYESIEHPILITLSPDTPPHQFEACNIAAASMPNSKVVHVPGGHMGLVTNSEKVLPHLIEWILD